MNVNFITNLFNIQTIKRPQGRFSLALACPEAGEIMPPKQMFGSVCHRLWIKRVFMMPNPSSIKRWRLAAR
jgi:hypothetical protein